VKYFSLFPRRFWEGSKKMSELDVDAYIKNFRQKTLKDF